MERERERDPSFSEESEKVTRRFSSAASTTHVDEAKIPARKRKVERGQRRRPRARTQQTKPLWACRPASDAAAGIRELLGEQNTTTETASAISATGARKRRNPRSLSAPTENT